MAGMPEDAVIQTWRDEAGFGFGDAIEDSKSFAADFAGEKLEGFVGHGFAHCSAGFQPARAGWKACTTITSRVEYRRRWWRFCRLSRGHILPSPTGSTARCVPSTME